MQVLKHAVFIDAPPSEVWRILTTPELVKEWAAAFLEGLSIRTSWRPGGEVAWKTPGGTTRSAGVVAACEPERLLKFEYTRSVLAPDGQPVCETFEVAEDSGGARLEYSAGPFDPATLAGLKGPAERAAREIKSLAEESAEIHRTVRASARRERAAGARS